MTDSPKKPFKPPDPGKIDVSKELEKGLSVYQSLKVEVMVTTVDKARACLVQTHGHMASMMGWTTPFGILLAIVITLLTCQFHDVFYLTKDNWADVFKVALGVFGLWFIAELYRLARVVPVAWKAGIHNPVDRFIALLKAESETIFLQPAQQLGQATIAPPHGPSLTLPATTAASESASAISQPPPSAAKS